MCWRTNTSVFSVEFVISWCQHITCSFPLLYLFCNEGALRMFIDKIMELYREACVHGLPVSLSLSHHNGRESFSFTTIPGPDLAGRPERRRRPRGGRRRRGRGIGWLACA